MNWFKLILNLSQIFHLTSDECVYQRRILFYFCLKLSNEIENWLDIFMTHIMNLQLYFQKWNEDAALWTGKYK